jgi:hypothetical protein
MERAGVRGVRERIKLKYFRGSSNRDEYFVKTTRFSPRLSTFAFHSLLY